MQDASRRMMLKAGTALAAAALLPATAAARSFFQRARLPIGLQVYTLGPEAAADLDATFARIAAIGYREIELPGLYGKPPTTVGAAARRAGLAIGSLHLPLVTGGGSGTALSLASDPARIADALETLGAKWAVAPLLLLPPGTRPNKGEKMESAIARLVTAAGADGWKRTAALLNERGTALKAAGVRLAYHNHNLEFAPVAGTTGWEILRRETDPALVSFEIDIGWVAAAGLDPVAFLAANRGRVALLHVKDVAAVAAPDYAIAMQPATIGRGVLDWRRILPAAYRAGARHFYVEQEPPFPGPRIDAAAQSYTYLVALDARP